MNKELSEAGSDALANARNAAAGALRLLNPSECASRRLSFVAFQLLILRHGGVMDEGSSSSHISHPADGVEDYADGLPLSFVRRQSECLSWLSSRGFATSPDVKTCRGGLEEALKQAEMWMSTRKDLGEKELEITM